MDSDKANLNKKINIAVDMTSYLIGGLGGGVAQATFSTITALSKRVNSITLLTLEYNYEALAFLEKENVSRIIVTNISGGSTFNNSSYLNALVCESLNSQTSASVYSCVKKSNYILEKLVWIL